MKASSLALSLLAVLILNGGNKAFADFAKDLGLKKSTESKIIIFLKSRNLFAKVLCCACARNFLLSEK